VNSTEEFREKISGGRQAYIVYPRVDVADTDLLSFGPRVGAAINALLGAVSSCERVPHLVAGTSVMLVAKTPG